MNTYELLQKEIRDLNTKKDWDKYHNPKDLIIAVNVEAAELLEHTLWKKENEIINDKELHYEISDVYIYLLQLCDKLNVDINEIALDKAKYNTTRFTNDGDK